MANGSAFAELLIKKMLADALEAKTQRGDSGKDSTADLDETIVKLQKACADYQQKYKFKVGDVVTWKDNHKGSRKWPEIGQPAVVVEVFSVPYVMPLNKKTIGTSLVGEVLDIRIVVDTGDGELSFFAYPSVGFQPWEVYQASIREAVDAGKKIVNESVNGDNQD